MKKFQVAFDHKIDLKNEQTVLTFLLDRYIIILNNFIWKSLIESGGGTGPVKPGNHSCFTKTGTGAKSCKILCILKNKRVRDTFVYFHASLCERHFLMHKGFP